MGQNELKARDCSADNLITGTLELGVRQSHPCSPKFTGVRAAPEEPPARRETDSPKG